MKALLVPALAALAITACTFDDGRPSGGGGGGGGGGGTGGGGGGGSNQPPGVVRGKQTMSDVHVESSGTQAWIIHSAVVNDNATPKMTTAHLGAYLPEDSKFVEVLDTTGTLGKRLLFPRDGRLLLVTAGGGSDVLVTIDTVARRPVRQHSYPGDRTDFKLSPSGRAVVAGDRVSGTLHLIDTESLVDQVLPATSYGDVTAWANTEDVLYVVSEPPGAPAQLQRFDLRTADLTTPIAPAAALAGVPAASFLILVSPGDRYVAVTNLTTSVAVVDVARAATTMVAADGFPAFTNDDRLVFWQPNPKHGHDLRILTPDTGAVTSGIGTSFQVLPEVIALRHRDLVIAQPFELEPGQGFLLNTIDGTRIPLLGSAAGAMFERPGHPDLWIWREDFDALAWFDLTTGVGAGVVTGADSVDYRAGADDIVVGTFDHAVYRISMATRQPVGARLVLPDPNDVTAPYKLGSE